MFIVYEVFKKDKKKFHRFQHEDKFTCEIYVDHHKYDYGALLNGDSELIIEEEVEADCEVNEFEFLEDGTLWR